MSNLAVTDGAGAAQKLTARTMADTSLATAHVIQDPAVLANQARVDGSGQLTVTDASAIALLTAVATSAGAGATAAGQTAANSSLSSVSTSTAATAAGIGTTADAAWSGSGVSTIIAALKAIWAKLNNSTAAPSPPNGAPGTIGAGSSYVSGIIAGGGAKAIAAAVTLSQPGSISIQRYINAGGTIAIGAAVVQTLSAATPGTVAVNDGLPFASFQITVTNSSGSSGSASNFALLTQ